MVIIIPARMAELGDPHAIMYTQTPIRPKTETARNSLRDDFKNRKGIKLIRLT